jgi:GDPmannose 4,6-dehydratase
MDIEWRGAGVDEKGFDASGNCIVEVDPRYFRPTEVETLLGDPSKAKLKLGWETKVSFKELVSEMMSEDMKEAKKNALIREHGYQIFESHE